MTLSSISNKRRWFEISAVIATAVGKFIFMDHLNWKFPFITVAFILWVIYIVYRGKTKPGILKYWGFRTDNFNKVLKMVLPYGLLAVIVFFAIGFFHGTINITWHIIPILIMYPFWGVIQQYLIISLTAGNLFDMKGLKLNKISIILLTALLFGGIHYPYIWLIIATFILALFYGFIFLKERNIYVLGIFHGWLGAIFFYTVVGRDPFCEMFKKLCQLNNG